jgi:uncharacterized membrane protein YphA (DoxX/SURF4 family)
MKLKVIKLSSWVLTTLLSALFSLSAITKIIKADSAIQQAQAIGIDAGTNQILGIIELVAVILFIIPRTGIVGALLLMSYMGGAIATHLQHGQPLAFVIIIQSLIWITAALRFKELTNNLFSIQK